VHGFERLRRQLETRIRARSFDVFKARNGGGLCGGHGVARVQELLRSWARQGRAGHTQDGSRLSGQGRGRVRHGHRPNAHDVHARRQGVRNRILPLVLSDTARRPSRKNDRVRPGILLEGEAEKVERPWGRIRRGGGKRVRQVLQRSGCHTCELPQSISFTTRKTTTRR
jgi:hypothetical protein